MKIKKASNEAFFVNLSRDSVNYALTASLIALPALKAGTLAAAI